jgi:hypothetical protein
MIPADGWVIIEKFLYVYPHKYSSIKSESRLLLKTRGSIERSGKRVGWFDILDRFLRILGCSEKSESRVGQLAKETRNLRQF